VTALAQIEAGLIELGYRPESLIHDYSFADVLSATGEERRVELAAFTQMPESYRSAAFGVISGPHEEEAVEIRRALGAPILFSIGESDVGVWRVGAEGRPRLTERVPIEALPELFARNAGRWSPQSVHRAKSLGQTQVGYQLDFVDLGLLPAIEHEVEQKLDRLLERVIKLLVDGTTENEREEAAFRATFRLLAAKILVDRQHPGARSWADAPVLKVLDGIEAYYNLDHLSQLRVDALPVAAIEQAWAAMREAINFRNISSDSLAFVYENTLVTADTRKRFGTHSTPRQVAEYVVGQLDLGQFDPAGISIFEPFAGAGTFLVAALRHLRDQLPEDMSGEERHAFLVPRISGAEIDSFACEVATLSLILADYPNANGWKIEPRDLFHDDALAHAVDGKRIILCNPPWEEFEAEERLAYPKSAAKSFSKPMAVLRTVLEAKPDAIGFILPQGLLRQQQYAELRQMVADLYGRVDLTSLPDRVFQRAGLEGAVLVASDRRETKDAEPIALRSTVVEDRDRTAFLTTGKVTAERRRNKAVRAGGLWIGQLDELWEYLRRYERLGKVADVYRGIKWWRQDEGVSTSPRDGFVPGVAKPADSLCQFGLRNTVYLNMDPVAAMFPGPPSRPWDKPKVLTNVARLSRGPWRMAAAFDRSGLVASQAFFGIWSTDPKMPTELFEAILNGPLTSAFLAEHASNQHFTNELLKQLPIPRLDRMGEVMDAQQRYRSAHEAIMASALKPAGSDDLLNRLLIEVDAAVLMAYDLPPRLERRLLEFFRGHESERRVDHVFQGWMPEDFTAYVPLHEYIGPLLRENRGPWALRVFTAAPEEEVERLGQYVQ
jgi:hypothetical protein